MATVAERIKALRLENDWTQQEVADRLGVNHVTISGYERGVRNPQFPEADALAELFDVNLEYLLGSSDVRGRYPKHGDQTVRVSVDELEVLRAYQAASPEIRAAVRAVLGVR
ncbi:MAG: helix-turn-helix transcriptional regulator [Lachnospiraceae bacterium]|nr:helix-turn-helix transcriptional regulator [Lachnospiraceae bacterium]MBR3330704.1 helix-turn-helix transcriptional regulator [Mogibacterium sp.]MBR4090395.1 helix-turn-helix transcriptional regulator [Mogibacterium sp.]